MIISMKSQIESPHSVIAVYTINFEIDNVVHKTLNVMNSVFIISSETNQCNFYPVLKNV